MRVRNAFILLIAIGGIALLAVFFASNASAGYYRGARFNDDTILKRAFPPYLRSLPTLLVPLGSDKHQEGNLVGIGCEDGSFYILAPGVQRFFMSHQNVARGPLRSVISIISSRRNDSYYLISSEDSLHIIHWNGSDLHDEKSFAEKECLKLIRGSSLNEVFGFSKYSIYKLEVDQKVNFSLSKERILATSHPIKSVHYSKSLKKIVCLAEGEIIIFNAFVTQGEEFLTIKLPHSSPPLKPAFSPFIAKRWERFSNCGVLWENADSSIYFFPEYLGSDSSWTLRKLVMSHKKSRIEDEWILKLPGMPHDLMVTGGNLYIGVGDISSDLKSSNSWILKVNPESGEVLKRIRLYMPPVFLSDWDGGVAALCFKVHIVLLNYDLDILSIDHSSIFPSAFLALDMNYDGTKDLIAAGERYCKLPDYFQRNFSKYFGITFGKVAITDDLTADVEFAVDCYINRSDALRKQALNERAAGEIMIGKRRFREAVDHLSRTRGLFATLKDKERVIELNDLLKRISRTIAFGSQMPLILVLSFCVGAVMGFYPRSLPIVRFSVGVILLAIPLQAIHLIGPVMYYPLAAYGAGFMGMLAMGYFYASITTSEAAKVYHGLQLSRESFTHGGSGSRILDSLKLLLGNASGMRKSMNEYLELIGRRIEAFRDLCMPQLYQLEDYLKRLSKDFFGNSSLRELVTKNDRSLERTLESREDVIQRSKDAYEDITRCRDELNRIFELLKRFPACDVASITKKTWNRFSFAGKGEFLFSLSKKDASLIAFIPEIELTFILENLFSNAARMLKSLKDPTISIKVYRRLSHVFIKYEDNGPGFRPEKIKEIVTSVRDLEGHGRGLSLSIEKLQRYGGSMKIHPSTKGAVIIIKLLSFGSKRSKNYVKA